MLYKTLNKVISRLVSLRSAWRAFHEGYRLGRDFAAGRSTDCPTCALAVLYPGLVYRPAQCQACDWAKQNAAAAKAADTVGQP